MNKQNDEDVKNGYSQMIGIVLLKMKRKKKVYPGFSTFATPHIIYIQSKTYNFKTIKKYTILY